MAHKISIELRQAWDTLDEAIVYFGELADDLKKLEEFKSPPTDLFLDVEVGQDPSDYTISIRNL